MHHLLIPFSWIDFQLDCSLVSYSSPKKFWVLSHRYFSQKKKKKKKKKIQKNKKVLPFWLRHHVSSTNVIIASFALYYFSHKEFIRSKEEIITPTKKNFLTLIADIIDVSVIIRSQMAPFTKSSKTQVIKRSSKRISIKTNRYFLFWWRHQATSINVIIGSQIVFIQKRLKK